MYRYKAIVLSSCTGLLMFLATSRANKIFVFNPVTQELITVPSPYALTTPCGIYFHPLTGEYKLLLCLYTKKNCLRCYYTYSLKSKVWKKLNHCSSCRTRGNPSAIMLNRFVHWMANCHKINDNKGAFNSACRDGIMLFGTKTEDFRVLPHPGDACCYNPREHENMHLSGTRDHLCLCHVSWHEVIHVWVLEDYASWGWVRRYKINLNWDVKRFPFEVYSEFALPYDPRLIKPLGIHDGELVISWALRGTFTHNLKQNTVSKIPIKAKPCLTFVPYASAYTKSLITLSDLSAGLEI